MEYNNLINKENIDNNYTEITSEKTVGTTTEDIVGIMSEKVIGTTSEKTVNRNKPYREVIRRIISDGRSNYEGI